METISSRIVMPSVNMLPIDEIKEALGGIIQAKDTTKVAGIDSSRVAISYNNDRESVKTAYYLGDRPAEEYLTVDLDPTQTIKALETKQQSEITGLRLELYRLYEILNRQLGANYAPESGYLEEFIETIAVSTTAQVVNSESNIFEIKPLNVSFAIPKEYIVIDDGEEQHLAQIASVENGNYKLTGAIDSPIRELTIYKIKGEMLKNTYSFSHTSKDVLSGTIHNIILGDYAEPGYESIGKGIATNLKIRANMLATDGNRDKAILDNVRVYITRETLQASSQVVCKIYNVTRMAGVPSFDLIGTSKDENITYDRWVSFKITSDGLPLEVHADQELLVAFECNTANSFKIQVGKGVGGSDLLSNRDLYSKKDGEYQKLSETMGDILLSVAFSGYVQEVTEPFRKGLYTSKTFINEREDNCLAQLQLKLRNITKGISKSSTPNDGFEGFVVDKELQGTGKMVIGNNVATFYKSTNNTFFTDEHIAIYPNDEVYFIPVKAQIVAMSELFNAYTVSQVVEMNPVRVSGDYLIFECRLPEHVKRFNVQVAYEYNGNVQAAALESIAVSLI